MKRLSPEDKQYILKRHQEGAALRAIGRELDRPDITVRRTLEAAGIDFGPPKTSNKRTLPEIEELVLRLYDAGKSWQVINEQAGITSVTLGKILKRNGREYDRRSDAEANAGVIATLYAAGYSTRVIGATLGHGKSTVNRVVDRHGGELRQMTGTEVPTSSMRSTSRKRPTGWAFSRRTAVSSPLPSIPKGITSRSGWPSGIRATWRSSRRPSRPPRTSAGASLTASGSPRSTQASPSARGGSQQALIALGISPRKSATVKPWDGPAELMPHYWRGLFDGDGSIARKSQGLWTMFLCGSEACVRGFTAWAHDICGTNATPYFNTGCWYVSISGRHQVAKLARAMYEDAPVSARPQAGEGGRHPRGQRPPLTASTQRRPG